MNRHAIFLAALALLLFGIVARLLPHFPNATPLTAIAFASSIYLGRWWALVLPLCALFLSDMIIGFYDWRIMAGVYGSFALIGCWSWISRKYGGIIPVFLAVVGAPIFFFLITNAAVWLFSPWYEKNVSGLLYSYELGIPFFRTMLAGDLMYSTLLLGMLGFAQALIKRRPLIKLHGKTKTSTFI